MPSVLWKAKQSFFTVLLLGALITAGCLFYIWQWMNYRNIAQQVDKLERKHAVQIFHAELLEVEINYLTSPERLVRLAKGVMKMKSPEEQSQLISLSQISDPEQ